MAVGHHVDIYSVIILLMIFFYKFWDDIIYLSLKAKPESLYLIIVLLDILKARAKSLCLSKLSTNLRVLAS